MNRPVVLVTGASHGIGQSISALLASQGYEVFGTSRKPCSENDCGFPMLQLDVTSDESVKSCISSVMERSGRIDILVNNAAIGLIGAVEETSIAEAKSVFEANFFGAHRVVNAVLPGMRQRRSGLIINFGSLAATLPIPYHAFLSCSKAAIIAFSDALRLEVKPFNIQVTVVEPGMVATHKGHEFEQLKVARFISDYADPEQRAFAVIEKGQSAGMDSAMAAKAVLKIIRRKKPARYYLVGKEKMFVWLNRILPPSVVELLVIRHFHLSK